MFELTEVMTILKLMALAILRQSITNRNIEHCQIAGSKNMAEKFSMHREGERKKNNKMRNQNKQIFNNISFYLKIIMGKFVYKNRRITVCIYIYYVSLYRVSLYCGVYFGKHAKHVNSTSQPIYEFNKICYFFFVAFSFLLMILNC